MENQKPTELAKTIQKDMFYISKQTEKKTAGNLSSEQSENAENWAHGNFLVWQKLKNSVHEMS